MSRNGTPIPTLCETPIDAEFLFHKLLLRASVSWLLQALLLLVLPAVVQAQFTFTTNNGAITITRYTGSGGVVTIPDTTNGYPVTVIAGKKGAFSGSAVTSVTIPNSVTNIGSFAFASCTKLTNVLIPDSGIFVGDQAFSFCSSLTSVALGTNVTIVGNAVFRACNKLTSITVSELNTNYSSVAGVLFNKSQTALIAYPPGKSGSYSIPSGVTSVGSCAFETCAGLNGVTLPNGVTNIGANAFDSCSTLANITIPNSVASIGESAFYNCTSLAGIIIPNSVTDIGIYTFESCLNLTNVTIGNGLTSIADYLFYNCTSLTTITIGNSVTNIGFSAFANCNNLTRVYFQGNAPGVVSTAFGGEVPTVYYLPGTTGWENFALLTGVPTVLWNPQALTSDPSFGVRTSQFGFTITGSSNLVIVVEACTNLANSSWIPVGTNTLNTFIGTNGTSYFSDPQWTNYPGRFYRLRSR